MRSDVNRESLRRELEAAAEEVFDALYTEDLASLVAACGSRSELRDAVVGRAAKVDKKLGGAKDAVRPEERRLLIAACFTWGRAWAGVATRVDRASRKFLRYRRYAQVPVGVLVRTDRIVPDDERTVAVLALSLRVRAVLAEARSDQEPELILNMVVPAVVAALGTEPARPHGQDVEDVLAGITLDVLGRGAELAAAHRAVPALARRAGTPLPVTGNADFLVRIAAYRVAVEERRGVVVPRPLDAIEQAVSDLSDILRNAMTRPAGHPNRRGPDEPDVAVAIGRYADHLGAACGDDTGRRAVRAVHSVLNYRLGLGEQPQETAVEDIESAAAPSSGGSQVPSALPDVEHLVSWLIAALFQEAGPDAGEALLEWLDGKQVPDEAKNLPLLVRRLRVANTVLDQCPTSRPRPPAGITASRFQALTARLAGAVDPGDITGDARRDGRVVTLSALPPLWTDRRPAVLLVTSHLRVLLEGRQSAGLQAVLVAAHGVRAPVQFVQNSASPPPDPCCPNANASSRPSPGGQPREPVSYQEICPHRPWGEVGWVENRHTLGAAAGATPEAVRKQLAHYRGPWPELLAH